MIRERLRHFVLYFISHASIKGDGDGKNGQEKKKLFHFVTDYVIFVQPANRFFDRLFVNRVLIFGFVSLSSSRPPPLPKSQAHLSREFISLRHHKMRTTPSRAG